MTVLLTVLSEQIPKRKRKYRRKSLTLNAHCAQTSKHLPGEAYMNADRNVIRKQRCVHWWRMRKCPHAGPPRRKERCYKKHPHPVRARRSRAPRRARSRYHDAHKPGRGGQIMRTAFANNLITTPSSVAKTTSPEEPRKNSRLHASPNETAVNGAPKRHNIKPMVWGIWVTTVEQHRQMVRYWTCFYPFTR